MTALTWTILYDPSEDGAVVTGFTMPTMDFGLTLNMEHWTPGTKVRVSNGKTYTVTEAYTLQDENGQHYRFDYHARHLAPVKTLRKVSRHYKRSRRGK